MLLYWLAMAMLVCSIPIVWRIAISVPLNSTTVYKDNIHGLYGQKQFVFTYIYLYIYIYTQIKQCVFYVYIWFSVSSCRVCLDQLGSFSRMSMTTQVV